MKTINLGSLSEKHDRNEKKWLTGYLLIKLNHYGVNETNIRQAVMENSEKAQTEGYEKTNPEFLGNVFGIGTEDLGIKNGKSTGKFIELPAHSYMIAFAGPQMKEMLEESIEFLTQDGHEAKKKNRTQNKLLVVVSQK